MPHPLLQGPHGNAGASHRRTERVAQIVEAVRLLKLRGLERPAEAPQDRAAREGACRALAATFREAGKLLWVVGYMVGPDRPEGQSPFGFGSDATVGLALVVKTGGELLSGATTLLDGDNLYGAAALLRQLVEVEYLAWAFSEDEEQAMAWIRASPRERLRLWQPGQLRKLANGRFQRSDYSGHCERGGHPTPEAMLLLPDHGRRVGPGIWWLDLAEHGVRTWGHVVAAADRLGNGELTRKAATKHALSAALDRWRSDDPLPPLLGDTLLVASD
jgi:hypothetical protein